MEQMKQTKFEPLPSYGSYFQLYSYKNISEEKERSFAERLVKEVGVATIPVAAFYKTPVENQVVRFCFAKKRKHLAACCRKTGKFTISEFLNIVNNEGCNTQKHSAVANLACKVLKN